jgi:hypothetical protein
MTRMTDPDFPWPGKCSSLHAQPYGKVLGSRSVQMRTSQWDTSAADLKSLT